MGRVVDAMRAAGMPDGHYLLGDYRVEMKDGVVRTATGGLAGSTLTLLGAVRTLVHLAGVPLAEAIQMASLAPARMLGIDDQLGSLAVVAVVAALVPAISAYRVDVTQLLNTR